MKPIIAYGYHIFNSIASQAHCLAFVTLYVSLILIVAQLGFKWAYHINIYFASLSRVHNSFCITCWLETDLWAKLTLLQGVGFEVHRTLVRSFPGLKYFSFL
jgi:hypothetical protein